MRTKMVYLLGIVLAFTLTSVSHAYETEIIDENGSHDEEQTYGTAHHLMAYAGSSYGGANSSSTVQVWVTDDEWGIAAACKDGYTTIRVTDYDPNVDPPIHLYYRYIVSAFVIFDVLQGAPPASGSGSGQGHAIFNPGYYQADASLSYTGEEYEKDYKRIDVEHSVDMSYKGAEFETYGVSYADVSVSVGGTTSELEGWSYGGVYESCYQIYED